MGRLTHKKMQHIRELHESGVRQVDIAKELGIAQSTISALLRRPEKPIEPHEISYAGIRESYPEYSSIFDTVIKRHVAYKRFIGNKLVYDRKEVEGAFALYQKILDKEYLDMPQIAKILKVTRQRVVQILQEGVFHTVLFGARRYVPRHEVYEHKKRRICKNKSGRLKGNSSM